MRSREDRRIYANVHGQAVIKHALKEAAQAGGGWAWRTGYLRTVVREEFRRSGWVIVADWSEGGRIKGAGVHSPNGHLQLGMIGNTRDKKGKLLRLLAARDDDDLMKELVSQIKGEVIADIRSVETQQ